jgi:hypothetical protein
MPKTPFRLITLVFWMPKPVAAQHIDLVGVAEPIGPAPLSKPWQNSPAPLIKPWQDLRDEMESRGRIPKLILVQLCLVLRISHSHSGDNYPASTTTVPVAAMRLRFAELSRA